MRSTFPERPWCAAGDRRFGIALNRNQLAFLVKYKLTATHGAVRADRPGYFRSLILGAKRLRAVAHRFRAGAISAVQNLMQYRPLEHKFLNHLTSGDSRVFRGC
jgi:hypothetical protein